MIDTADRTKFLTVDGSRMIPAVSGCEMGEVDRLAVDVFRLNVLR